VLQVYIVFKGLQHCNLRVLDLVTASKRELFWTRGSVVLSDLDTSNLVHRWNVADRRTSCNTIVRTMDTHCAVKLRW